MRRFITKGPKEGRCNICGDFGLLTEDHTPPKGCARIKQVEMNTLIEILNADGPTKGGRISQNGTKFRSLCKRCNNSLLGGNYDLAFIDFTIKVKAYITSNISLPPVMTIKSKPQKIARALYGHLSAIGVDQYFETENEVKAKEWFLDESKEFPNCFRIFYWPYPYKKQILIRGAGLRNLDVEDTAFIWVMKFFPIAFFIIWDKPNGYDFPHLANFDKWTEMVGDEEAEIPIHLNNIPHERWPESPEDNSFLGFNSDLAVGAIERNKQNSNFK